MEPPKEPRFRLRPKPLDPSIASARRRAVNNAYINFSIPLSMRSPPKMPPIWLSARPADAEDLAYIFSLDSESLISQIDPEWYARRISDTQNSITHIARDSRTGEKIGFVFARDSRIEPSISRAGENYPGFMYLSRMAINPKYRNLGIGTTLVAAVETDAYNMGYPGVISEVRLSNNGGLRVHYTLGYFMDGEGSGPGKYSVGTWDERYGVLLYKDFRYVPPVYIHTFS